MDKQQQLGLTPPMGWNSWNTFTWDINEQLIREAADTLVADGYKDAGYDYIVIDDCWSLKDRDKDGKLVADPVKFPNGMKAVADYIHSKGLKFGMYSCVGTHTCAGYPGSFEHEFQDAESLAEWGVDFLKYDYCFKPRHMSGELLYKRMSLALKKTAEGTSSSPHVTGGG
ncbi:glycoside hydrolase family 27 protein [Paenibacillus rhizoplanae]